MKIEEDSNSIQKDMTMDSAFKEIMSDSSILSNVLEPLIDEFNGKDVEYIKQCLPIEEGNRKIVKLDTEFGIDGQFPVRLDNVFEVKIPGGEAMTIIINLEGQTNNRPDYFIEDRALYYATRLIQSQKGRYFDSDHYENMRKVMSIWVMMDPVKEDKNTICRYRLGGKYLKGFEGKRSIPACDLLEIVRINIGDAKDLPKTMMGLMNTLFSKGLTGAERVQILKDTYKIEDADYLFGELEDISMTLVDDLHENWKYEGVQEAIESGQVVSKEDYEAGIRQSEINIAIRIVNSMKDKGIPLEECLESVDEDIREAVKEAIEGKE